jgi:hypothetical protein
MCTPSRRSVAFDALEARNLFAATINAVMLIDADADRPIARLSNGAVIDLAALSTSNLNVLAAGSNDTASVRFSLDGDDDYRIESTAPFAMAGNDGADFYAWTPKLGEHTLTVTPYARANARGPAGDAVTVRFTVVRTTQTPRLTVAATPINTSSLAVTWDAPSAVAQFAARYRVTATPGTFWGPRRTIEVDATARSTAIKGLESFKQYTIDVVALDANGDVVTTGKGVAMTSPSATQQRYLYAVSLPYNRRGFRNLAPKIEVFDVNDGHRWVKDIPLPDGIYNARGVAVNAATGRMYVSFFNTPADKRQPGGIVCVDLNTDQVLWTYRYDPKLVPSPDRFALTPDGAKIYMPVGEGSADATWWLVLDGATGEPTGTEIHHVSAPHNTIVSIDGRYAFLEGQEFGDQPSEVDRTIAVVDTATDTVIRRIGRFRDVVRPFTITGDAKYLFATENNFVGFEVADIETGEILYTVPVPGVVQREPGSSAETDCHGIAITPDEKLLFLNDRVSGGVQVFDISGLRDGQAPRYLKLIRTRQYGRDLSGNVDPAAREDTTGMPGWLAVSYDGRYVYPESGEVIDTETLMITNVIKGSGGLYLHSKFMSEVVFDNGKAIRVTDQFGVGRVR